MIYEYCEQDDECLPINFNDSTDYPESYLTWAGNDHSSHVSAYYDHIFDDVVF